jgi:pantoate--beta-alanine ligase
MRIVHTFEEVREAARGTVGLVPTMGFLHEGHLSLVGESSSMSDFTVVTIFVNPLQFSDADDLETYPRDLERDATAAEAAGADLLIAPSVGYMYPEPLRTSVTVSGATASMEGLHRPGHFEGVATVVAKLFAGIRPDIAFFGRKDAQQLAVISTLARDLSFPVRVVGCPVVREHDGLALSSRNIRLDSSHRGEARAISTGLMHAADLIESGLKEAAVLTHSTAQTIMAAGDVAIDYVELADAMSAAPADHVGGRQFLAVAGKVGPVRLLDSITIEHGIVDRGLVLSSPSILYGGS